MMVWGFFNIIWSFWLHASSFHFVYTPLCLQFLPIHLILGRNKQMFSCYSRWGSTICLWHNQICITLLSDLTFSWLFSFLLSQQSCSSCCRQGGHTMSGFNGESSSHQSGPLMTFVARYSTTPFHCHLPFFRTAFYLMESWSQVE